MYSSYIQQQPKLWAKVSAWFQRFPESQFYITAITQAEILYRVALSPAGKRKTIISATAEAMLAQDFAGRILPFDMDAANVFANIASSRRKRGQPIGQFDAQIAAIVNLHSAVLATRNAEDFHNCGITVLNPWQQA